MYKLLVVDDNYTQIQCVLSYVNWAEFNISDIRTATNGAEGYDEFKKFKPDIVITDVVMPVSDGLDMTLKIRKLNKSTKIVFMSCYEDFNYVKTAIDNNATSYILKPVKPDTLREVIREIVSEIEELHKYENMNKLLSESLQLLRESFLYRILYSKHINSDYLKDTYHNLDFDKYKNFVVARFKLLESTANYVDIYNLLNITKNEFSKEFSIDAIIESSDKLIVLIMSNEPDSEILSNNVIDALHAHIGCVTSEYNLPVIVGISNVYGDLSNAALMLNQATLAIESIYSHKAGEIYFYEEHEYENLDYDISYLKDDINVLLETADNKSIDIFLQKYYAQNSRLNKNTVKSLCFSVVTTLQILLLERNADIKDLLGNSSVIWAKLDKFETIQDTRQWLKNLLIASCEFITNNEKNKRKKIISNIISNIEKNFSTISSIEQVASDLYISTGYAKNIFKKYTGQTIFDYLIKMRMKEAKKLLSDPEIKVYEVSELVGYKSKAHFTETFKRNTGITPKEFQQQYTVQLGDIQ